MSKQKSTGVFNQEVVDWMKQLPQGKIVKQRQLCVVAGWDPEHHNLTEHAVWMLAMDHWMDYEVGNPDSGWTWPTARDAQEALRFLNK